tara:strand:+ start:26581 stop:26757 length:177 start_codon:yes stop_codon:yes gene_type:complete
MTIAQEIRKRIKDMKCSLRDMCEQECTRKDVDSRNRTVEFKFSDGSTIGMLATQDDME